MTATIFCVENPGRQIAAKLTIRYKGVFPPGVELPPPMIHCCVKPSSYLAVVILLFSGCGEPNPLGRYRLSGSVTFQGKPLDQGLITFEPLDPNKGVGSGALITEGKYDIPTDKGLPAGRYIVRITSTDPSAPPPADAMPGDAPVVLGKERIPPKWNLESDQQIEVKPEGEHVYNFEIQ